MSAAPAWVAEYLFRPDGLHAYAVLDGASVPDLPLRLWEHEPEHVCLYRGELEPDLAETAPYLVRLEPASPFTRWVLVEGWGEHWGIFVRAGVDLQKLRNRFRRFLIVRSEEGAPLYFAFYDPRVLRIFLPTCDAGQLEEMFEDLSEYLAEAEDPGEGHVFAFASGNLGSTMLGSATAGGPAAGSPARPMGFDR